MFTVICIDNFQNPELVIGKEYIVQKEDDVCYKIQDFKIWFSKKLFKIK